MSDQLKSALIRGLILALCAGLATALTTWSQTNDGKTIAIAAGTALVTTFATRFGGEGTYDTGRDARGEVHAGDVVAKPT